MLGWGSLRAESRWTLVPCAVSTQVPVEHLTSALGPALDLAPLGRAFCLWGAPSLTGEIGITPPGRPRSPGPLVV